ncbi:hypothetical protein LINPERHAP2_LOCUS8186 [Linum perenne]
MSVHFLFSFFLPISSATINENFISLRGLVDLLIGNHNGLIQILNLRLIPWGNALVQPDGSFLCQVQSTLFLFLFQFDFKFRIISQIVTVRCFYQHGPNECVLNTVDACTIAVYPDADFSNFESYICQAYRGMATADQILLPDVCNSLPSTNYPMLADDEDSVGRRVCYAEETEQFRSAKPELKTVLKGSGS